MNRFYRRALIGGFAGLIASVPLNLTLSSVSGALAEGVILGAAFTVPIRPPKNAYLDALMLGGAFGIPCWGLSTLLQFLLISGQNPQWDAEGMRAHFPALVGWVCYGALLGVLVLGLSDMATKLFGPELAPAPPAEVRKRRIVILGGGFAGMQTAVELEHELRGDPSVSITLVSETNALLFTPMLAEVAGRSVARDLSGRPRRHSGCSSWVWGSCSRFCWGDCPEAGGKAGGTLETARTAGGRRGAEKRLAAFQQMDPPVSRQNCIFLLPCGRFGSTL
jgi:NADH:quinone reductase (non-electrogenic)